MKILEINSKKYGKKEVLLDDEDYLRLQNDFKNTKWCISKTRNCFYVQKRIENKKIVFLHRYIINAPKNTYVDHINHNTLDNRKCNLRIVSNADNLRNGNIRTNNKTGVNGVYFDSARKKYAVSIKVNYKKINLGRYDTLKEAKAVRKEAEIKYWDTLKGGGE